jgi:hypothetical protein
MLGIRPSTIAATPMVSEILQGPALWTGAHPTRWEGAVVHMARHER